LTVDPTEPVLITDPQVTDSHGTGPHVTDPYADGDDDDEEDDYLPRPSTGRRIPALTAVLLLAIVVTAAFFSGVEVQKSAGKVKSSNAAAALATAGATGAASGTGTGGGTGTAGGGFGGGGGGGGRTGGRTVGLVTNVQPGVISITDAQGNVVKIATTGNPTVSKSTQGALSDIQIGNTIVVQGQPASDGSVKATSITIGSPTGGFGGGGQGGGSAAGG
jgi:hypothetical protein